MLVVILLVLLCVLLWMGWQFQKYVSKLRSQETRLAELECRMTTGPLDKDDLVHKEDCAQWSSNRVGSNVFLYAVL